MPTDYSTVIDDRPQGSTQTASASQPNFDVKRLIRLRSKSIIIVAVTIAIPAMLITWFITPIVYTASAELRFESTEPFVMTSTGNRAGGANYDKYVSTELSIITGSTIISRVVEDPGIRKLPGLALQSDLQSYLLARVEAVQLRRSTIITVTCTLPDKDEALAVLATIIEEYMAYAQGQRGTSGNVRLEPLRTNSRIYELELVERQANLAKIQAELGDYTDNGTLAESAEGSLNRERLYTAQEAHSQAASRIIDLQEKVAGIDALLQQTIESPDKPIFEFGVEIAVKADLQVIAQQQNLIQQRILVNQLAAQQRETSPQLKTERNKLKPLAGSLVEAERTARNNFLNSLRPTMELEVSTAQKIATVAKNNVDKYTKLLEDFLVASQERRRDSAKRLALIEDQKAKVDATREYLTSINDKIRAIEIEKQAPARVQRVSSATVPDSPNYSNHMIFLVLVLFTSCGIGITVGVITEFLDKQVRNQHDIARVTQLDVIAAIPHTSQDPNIQDSEIHMITKNYPHSTTANEYRRILARMLYPEDESAEINSLLIVSPTMNDGKTSLACNLSIALAQSQRRVLLMDLSSQSPGIEKCFGMEPQLGLAELLSGARDKNDLLLQSGIENLFLIGPGLDAPSLVGKLASREMMEFLEWADEAFDHTIIDTPPLLLMADAKLLAPAVDGVLTVIGAGVSSLGMIHRCLAGMKQLQANMIGVVLNGVKQMRGGYMKDNQKLYYDYFQEHKNGNGKQHTKVGEIKETKNANQAEEPIVLVPYGEDDEN